MSELRHKARHKDSAPQSLTRLPSAFFTSTPCGIAVRRSRCVCPGICIVREQIRSERSGGIQVSWGTRINKCNRLLSPVELRIAREPTSDQVHARQMMTEVATVSIVAKNKYSGKAGGLPNRPEAE